MPGSVAKILPKEGLAGKVFRKAEDIFSPEMPDVETPEPVAEASGLAAMQANERALNERKGLATTKVVQKSLLQQKQRQSLGGAGV